MKIGSLVFATEQGLGYLAKSFFDTGIVTDVLVVAHGKRPEQKEWYSKAQRIGDLHRQFNKIRRFCDDVDLMLFFETPFNWEIIPHCRTKNIPTVLMPMHECLPPVTKLPYQPDRFLCPSKLEIQSFGDHTSPGRAEFLTVPVDLRSPTCPDGVKWRKRERAEVFVHNAGWGGLKGRNGTKEFVDAIHLVKSPARFLIRCQEQITGNTLSRDFRGDDRVKVETGTVLRSHLWEEGDVFVFPEKFNGLSLPLQEARAAGMLVMTTYRFPNLDWLPNPPLISPREIVRGRAHPRFAEFDEAVHSPELIAAKIDEVYGMDISENSESGRQWGIDHSWESLRPRYIEYFERTLRECRGSSRKELRR